MILHSTVQAPGGTVSISFGPGPLEDINAEPGTELVAAPFPKLRVILIGRQPDVDAVAAAIAPPPKGLTMS